MKMCVFLPFLALYAAACGSREDDVAQGRQMLVLTHAFPGEVIAWRSPGSPAPAAIGVVCRVAEERVAIALAGRDTCATAQTLLPEEWRDRFSGYPIEAFYRSAALPYEVYLRSVGYKE
jgi:hypothetical protein